MVPSLSTGWPFRFRVGFASVCIKHLLVVVTPRALGERTVLTLVPGRVQLSTLKFELSNRAGNNTQARIIPFSLSALQALKEEDLQSDAYPEVRSPTGQIVL